jgi:predicted Zn-dependent protease
VIDLETWRQDHRPLLEHYRERARVLADLGGRADNAAREDLIRRTVWAIDRLRAHDPEAGGECTQAGQLLRLLGAEDLAWDYLTTPYAGKDEPPPLHGEAANLMRAGAANLGERMYRVAVEADPDNVALWWDRAQALHQAGRKEEARALFQALKVGAVNAKDSVYRERAKWWLAQH